MTLGHARRRSARTATRVVTASDDKTARLWDAATARRSARLEGHDGWVCSAAFSPDGTRLASGSD